METRPRTSRRSTGTLELLVQAKANLEATNAEGLTVLGAVLTPGGAASAIQLLEAHGSGEPAHAALAPGDTG